MIRKPSVTKLIGQLDKPYLVEWANRKGLEGIDIRNYRKDKMASGTSMHKQIEEYFMDGVIPENKLLYENILGLQDYISVIDMEKKIETDIFKGRLDIKLYINSKTYICDFKSNHKRVYLENILQLTAYRMAESCDGIGIISIPDMVFVPIEITNFEPYEELLKHLYHIYIIKKSL